MKKEEIIKELKEAQNAIEEVATEIGKMIVEIEEVEELTEEKELELMIKLAIKFKKLSDKRG